MSTSPLVQKVSTSPLVKRVFDSSLETLQNDKIAVFHICSTSLRKQIHNYLDQVYPQLKGSSFKTQVLSRERLHTIIPCPNCDNKKVHIDEYHCGFMDNNQDEYRTGTCRDCEERVSYEINYDDSDDVKYVFKNNLITVGHYFRHYIKPSYVKPEKVDISTINFENISVYIIDAPKIDKKNPLKTRELSKYISNEIEKCIK
jgi:hypothetical protein